MPAELEATSAGRRLPGSKQLLAQLGDERLIGRIRRGDQLAFEVVYDRHHRPLLAFCRRMLGSTEEGEDALQQTFLSAYRALAGGSEKPAKLKPWLYTIARNRCVSMLRARGAPATSLNDQEAPAGGGLSVDVEQRAEVRRLLESLKALPDAQREALVLSELGDLSHADVARVLDCPPSKVKSLVFQARTGLLEQRAASELSCREAREEIAALGRLPRSGPIRRHARTCADCSAFGTRIRRQRRLMAVALPVVPSAGLKRSALAATGVGGGGGAGGMGAGVGGKAVTAATAGASASGGSAAGGGLAGALTTASGIAKATAVALASGGLAVGTGVAVKQEDPRSSQDTHRTHEEAPASNQRGSTPAFRENGSSRSAADSQRTGGPDRGVGAGRQAGAQGPNAPADKPRRANHGSSNENHAPPTGGRDQGSGRSGAARGRAANPGAGSSEPDRRKAPSSDTGGEKQAGSKPRRESEPPSLGLPARAPGIQPGGAGAPRPEVDRALPDAP